MASRSIHNITRQPKHVPRQPPDDICRVAPHAAKARARAAQLMMLKQVSAARGKDAIITRAVCCYLPSDFAFSAAITLPG